MSFSTGSGNSRSQTDYRFGEEQDYLPYIYASEMYGRGGVTGSQFHGTNPNRPGGPGDGEGGRPRPTPQPAPGEPPGRGLGPQSAQGGQSSVPPHVATSYGFWADEQGRPGGTGFVGAQHAFVHFGADGYIDRIISLPTSANNPNGASQHNIPFNPWSPGGAAPAQQGTFAGLRNMRAGVPGVIEDPSGVGRGDVGNPGFNLPPGGTPGGGGEGGAGGGGGGTGGVRRPPIIPVIRPRPAPQTVAFRPPGDLGSRKPGKHEGVPGTPIDLNPPPPGGGDDGGLDTWGPPIQDVPPYARAPYPTMWGEGGASGNRQLAGAGAYGAYSSLVEHPELSPEVRNAIAQEGMNAARARYAGAGGAISRRAAATGSSAGVNAALAQLGRDEAETLGSQARSNVIDFERERQRRLETGARGLSGLHGVETGYMTSLLSGRSGAANRPLGTRSQGSQSGTQAGFDLGDLLSIIGLGG